MSQIASLFANLGFTVDDTNLKKFERQLDRTEKKIKAQGKAVVDGNKRASKSHSQLAVAHAKAQRQKRRIERSLVTATGDQRKNLLNQQQVNEKRLHDISMQQRAIQQKRDYELWKQRGRLTSEQANREIAHKKAVGREEQKQKHIQEKRDYQQHQQRTRRYNQEQAQKAQHQRLQQKRDIEMYRMRGERERLQRATERRHHQQKMHEQTRERRGIIQSRGFQRGAGAGIGVYGAMRSSGAYQGYLGAEQALTAATGDQDLGKAELQWLIEMSQQVGVFAGDITREYGKFAASAQETSLSLQQQRDIFRSFSEYGRVLNLDSNNMGRIFYALQQMMSNGIVLSQELQTQLGDVMPGALQVFAKAAVEAGMISAEGLTETDTLVRRLKDEMKEGNLTSGRLLPYVAEELAQTARAGGALDVAMKSTSAAMSRFRNSIWLANKTFNESGFDKGMGRLVNEMSRATDEAQPLWETLGAGAGIVAQAFRPMFELAGTLGSNLDLLTGFIDENATSFKLLGAALVVAVPWLRRAAFYIYGLTVGAAALSELISDPSRERSWQEWIFQLGSIAVFAAVAAGGLWKLVKAARAVKGAMKRVPGIGNKTPGSPSTGSKAPGSAPQKRGGTNPSSASKIASKRLPLIAQGVAAWELLKLPVDAAKEAHKATNESPQDWINRRAEERGIDVTVDVGDRIRGWLDTAFEPLRSNAQGMPGFNPDELKAYHERVVGDTHVRTNNSTTNNNTFTFNIESSDPHEASLEIERTFKDLFDTELRISSAGVPIAER